MKTAILWDFDGTLSYAPNIWNYAVLESARAVAPGITLPTMEELYVLRRGAGFTFLWKDEWPNGSPVGEAWWDEMNARFFKVFTAMGLTDEQAEKAVPLIRQHIIDPSNYVLYPDAEAALEACRQKGAACVMISNNYPEAGDVIAALGIDRYFDSIIISGLEGCDKPGEGIFRLAMSRCPDAGRFIMVGDNIEADIGGAKALGIETVYVHRGENPLADHCFDTLMPIADLI